LLCILAGFPRYVNHLGGEFARQLYVEQTSGQWAVVSTGVSKLWDRGLPLERGAAAARATAVGGKKNAPGGGIKASRRCIVMI
jgi:hypothetical protein